ncbi:MAG: FAD-dependent thymidylate synthase, partial [Anaplasmataceae bacterium]|nr:FAD-dependent thymidylate synthase [Anaplasmataceae bacterium]
MTRANVKVLNDILEKEIKVLDKGFIRVIDYMGDDSSIVQAARVSYGKGTKSTSQDESLIRFLMQNQHTSPFEMCEIKLHVKLPMFVARQW